MPELRRLAIVGYGKMGRMIEQFAPEYGFSVALKLDEFNNANFEGVTAENFQGIDVAIDFSIPARCGATWKVSRRWASTSWSAPRAGSSTWTHETGRRSERNRAGLEPQLFRRRECILPHRARGRATAGIAAVVRRMGVGDSPFHQEGRSVRHAAEAGGRQ